MEFAKVTRNFGQTFKEGDDLEKFLGELISFIEREIYLARKVNFLLVRLNDQKVEFVADGNDDKDQDGNLRIINSGGNFLFQKMVNNVWSDENEITTTS